MLTNPDLLKVSFFSHPDQYTCVLTAKVVSKLLTICIKFAGFMQVQKHVPLGSGLSVPAPPAPPSQLKEMEEIRFYFI